MASYGYGYGSKPDQYLALNIDPAISWGLEDEFQKNDD